MKNIYKILIIILLLIWAVPPGFSQTVINVSVNQSEQLQVDSGSDTTICKGRSVLMNTSVSGGNPDYLYLWSPGTGLDNPFVANPVASPDTSITYTFTVIDKSNCVVSKEVRVFIDPCTGIKDINESSGINIYPNPNPGIFNIDFNSQKFLGKIEVRIINYYGQVIYQDKIYENNIPGSVRINIGKKPGGIYILQLISNKGIINKRFNIM